MVPLYLIPHPFRRSERPLCIICMWLQPNKPVPGSARVDTAKAAGITTVLLGLMQATVAALLR